MSPPFDPAEAARICGQAARTLAAALEWEKDGDARYDLSLGLVSHTSMTDTNVAVAAKHCFKRGTGTSKTRSQSPF